MKNLRHCHPMYICITISHAHTPHHFRPRLHWCRAEAGLPTEACCWLPRSATSSPVHLTVKTHCLACILTVRCAADDVTASKRTNLCVTEDYCSHSLKRGGAWAWLFLDAVFSEMLALERFEMVQKQPRWRSESLVLNNVDHIGLLLQISVPFDPL